MKNNVIAVNTTQHITDYDRELLQLLRNGYYHKEIATVLGKARSSVNRHCCTLLARLGARNSTQAVIFAIRKGLISLWENDNYKLKSRMNRINKVYSDREE